ncbi:maleylpyruvate isomerase family mycothiol-dependent enzyme [Nocardioides caricicola]|uniref:Maleylpyruvate isomerase family mycothiol-dependent enzyme n=1 Tax=Nocardioides caricicola TaxID=634770 RepID=A0ABW0MU80_9ACTN
MNPADEHRRVAATFTERVRGTTDWDAPAPVDGWVARDVVDHLVTWLPAFLEGNGVTGVGPGALSVADDPVAAWETHAGSVQALLEGPGAAQQVDDPRLGTWAVGDLVNQIYTADVFMHTWDLARASGQDDTLDAETCARLLAGMEQMEDVIRASGQYGARVEVPAGSDPQTRLLGFIGRDPQWRP